jgi:hypothetical protein
MIKNQRNQPEKPRHRIQVVRLGVIFEARTQPYTGGKIQAFAMSMGWDGRPILGFRHPGYEQRGAEAEAWLNQHQMRVGLHFGFSERGHWGLFVEKPEEPATISP